MIFRDLTQRQLTLVQMLRRGLRPAQAAAAKASINITSTPFLVEVDPSDNAIVIAKKGFQPWTRTLEHF